MSYTDNWERVFQAEKPVENLRNKNLPDTFQEQQRASMTRGE